MPAMRTAARSSTIFRCRVAISPSLRMATPTGC
jgi:hypothetical protein